jgi:hypothetical protein
MKEADNARDKASLSRIRSESSGNTERMIIRTTAKSVEIFATKPAKNQSKQENAGGMRKPGLGTASQRADSEASLFPPYTQQQILITP